MATFNGWPVLNTPTINSVVNGQPIAPRSIEPMWMDTVAVNTNPFTAQQQTMNWMASWMEFSVSWPSLTNSQACALEAWLMAVQGMNAVFSFGDPLNVGPQNPSATAPTVNGANQTGYVLDITGGGDLTIGDWFSLAGSGAYSGGSRWYRITGFGSGSLNIWPQIRESPSNG
jgi:hypothetical protein